MWLNLSKRLIEIPSDASLDFWIGFEFLKLSNIFPCLRKKALYFTVVKLIASSASFYLQKVLYLIWKLVHYRPNIEFCGHGFSLGKSIISYSSNLRIVSGSSSVEESKWYKAASLSGSFGLICSKMGAFLSATMSVWFWDSDLKYFLLILSLNSILGSV